MTKIKPQAKKSRAGRPANNEKTISKTYRFFETDVLEMLNTGKSPKEIFRLGILGLKNNPQMIARIREIEDGNSKLQAKLTNMSLKIIQLQEKKGGK